MIIGFESPLRRIPEGLNQKQLLCLDVLRLCADISDLAYKRLNNTLVTLSTNNANESINSLIISSITDAWLIIDQGHRFGQMISNFPEFQGNLPQFRFWPNRILRELRNYLQHLNERVTGQSNIHSPVLGTLTWQLRSDLSSGVRRIYAIQPGTYYPKVMTHIGGFEDHLDEEIGAIALRANQRTLFLQSIVSEITLSIRNLEDEIESQAGERSRLGSDIFFTLEKRETDVP
jgi:hypothetical protein